MPKESVSAACPTLLRCTALFFSHNKMICRSKESNYDPLSQKNGYQLADVRVYRDPGCQGAASWSVLPAAAHVTTRLFALGPSPRRRSPVFKVATT